MARIPVNIDVETAHIFIGGIWYNLDEVKQLIATLEEVMSSRGW